MNTVRSIQNKSIQCLCSGRLHTMWMKTTQQDLRSMDLSLSEAVDMAQNHPLWRMMSMFGTMHSQ